MTGFFIESGPVVQVKNTLGQVQVKDSDSGKPIYGGPMVVHDRQEQCFCQ